MKPRPPSSWHRKALGRTSGRLGLRVGERAHHARFRLEWSEIGERRPAVRLGSRDRLAHLTDSALSLAALEAPTHVRDQRDRIGPGPLVEQEPGEQRALGLAGQLQLPEQGLGRHARVRVQGDEDRAEPGVAHVAGLGEAGERRASLGHLHQ
jgi:hypothetical protein